MADHIAMQDQALADLAAVVAKRPAQFVVFYEDPENEDKMGITIFSDSVFLAAIPRIILERMLGDDIEI